MDWRPVQDVSPPLPHWLLGWTVWGLSRTVCTWWDGPPVPLSPNKIHDSDSSPLLFVVSKPTTKNSRIHTLELEGATGSLNHSFTLSHQRSLWKWRNSSKGCSISSSLWILLNVFFLPWKFPLFSTDLVLTVFLWTSNIVLGVPAVLPQIWFHRFNSLLEPFSTNIGPRVLTPPSRVYRNHRASKCDCSNVACSFFPFMKEHPTNYGINPQTFQWNVGF